MNLASVRVEDITDNFILGDFQAVSIHSDSVDRSHFPE
jgi:hypothetical protein